MSDGPIQLWRAMEMKGRSISWFHGDNGRESQLTVLQWSKWVSLFALFLTVPSFLIHDKHSLAIALSNLCSHWNILFGVRQTVTDHPSCLAFPPVHVAYLAISQLARKFLSRGKARKQKTSGLQNRVQTWDPKEGLWILILNCSTDAPRQEH